MLKIGNKVVRTDVDNDVNIYECRTEECNRIDGERVIFLKHQPIAMPVNQLKKVADK
ncbi:hypothetical protein [Listeria booriae]|uniref:Uncharacterized protein n=1 Tax=Listeria booriae TaxID=1552123 RepID=A0A842F3C2_9LIST|nr:hypothetical protein [Listeria booriae]MBC2241845.1 hypothetical protein [Listeria booriae]